MPDIDVKSKATLADEYQKGLEAARNNVPRWKSPEYYDKKKLETWYAGYDSETDGARLSKEVRPNMPEATAPADIVALQAATLLNDDEVKRGALSESDRSFNIRGVTLAWDKEIALRVLHPFVGGAPTLGYSFVTPTFRDVFFEAARSWHQRRRDELCAPLASRITNPEPPSPQPTYIPTTKRRGPLRSILIAVASLIGLGVAAGGISSCVNDMNQRAEVERARDTEVNRYGFQRGGITSRKVWPADCAGSGYQQGNDYGSGREFQSIYECKSYWERWEREGKIWIDWKDAQ